jgi:hypothetical protein
MKAEVILTRDDLIRERACESAQRWFDAHFGDEVAITRDFLEAVAAYSENYLEWLADRLCPFEHGVNGISDCPAWHCVAICGRGTPDVIDAILLVCTGEI